MKLFDTYNRINITASIITFVIGSCTYYFLLNYILIHQLDDTLKTEQMEIVSYVREHNALPEIIPTKDQYIIYQPGKVGYVVAKPEFLTLKKKFEKEEENYREVKFGVSVSGKDYMVIVDKPLEETEALMQVIIGVTVLMIGIILLTGYLINRIAIRRLWQPFYSTIARVQDYRLSDKPPLKLEKSVIEEFSLLNQSINEMTGRIQQDYSALKNFTGQAAHEMQTPLAIIRTRLDTLIQNESVLEKNAQVIMDMEKAVQRSSRLHQSLLLLTKVENRQFMLNEDVRLDKIIEDKCREYAEMTDAVHIDISLLLQPLTIKFHQHLAEIVVGNLLNNAIRYNKYKGNIDISLDERSLTVLNSSDNGSLDSEKLFKRFYRGNDTGEGTGLGLSIVKQVCDLAGYSIEYTYQDGRHIFTTGLHP